MKTLTALAQSIGATVVNLRFRANGKYQKGYAIVDKDSNEILTVEPCHYSNGDRWLVLNRCQGGIQYAKSLRELSNQKIKAGHTGFIFSGHKVN